jgi:hypothetical protein
MPNLSIRDISCPVARYSIVQFPSLILPEIRSRSFIPLSGFPIIQNRQTKPLQKSLFKNQNVCSAFILARTFDYFKCKYLEKTIAKAFKKQLNRIIEFKKAGT